MKRKIRILIADDHAIVRQGLASIIRFQSDMAVVGEAEDGDVAVRKTAELRPDVVIMDLLMPIMDGAKATKEIKRISPETRVIILTSFANSTDLSRALDNGASGAITKTSPKEELFKCIRNAADDERMIDPAIEQTLHENDAIPVLTNRQAEILHSLSRGLTNAEIAKQLGISTGCIKFHILAIFRKLGAANRSEAVDIAHRKHLLKT